MFNLENIVNTTDLNLSDETWESICSAHTFGDTDYALINWQMLLDHCCESDYERLKDTTPKPSWAML